MSVNFSISQNTKAAISLRMKAQMSQRMRLLELPLVELKTELSKAFENNPMVESISASNVKVMSDELPNEHNNNSPADKTLDLTANGTKAEERFSADDGYRDYYLGNLESASGDEAAKTKREFFFDSQVKHETLTEHLLNQVPLADFTEKEKHLAELLIGSIDVNGYFTGSLRDLEMTEDVTSEELIATLTKIQQFDPLGCGARNLKECLLAQMAVLDDSPWEEEVKVLIEKHLEDLAQGKREVIREDLHITDKELNIVVSELRKLDPKPGRCYESDSKRLPAIYSEVEVVLNNGKPIALPYGGSWKPHIVYSKEYMALMDSPNTSKELKNYLTEQYNRACEIEDTINDRQKMICDIAQIIFDEQPDFFTKGFSGLKPFTISEVAEKLNLNISTVSRAVQNKYAKTPRGTVELRKFFSQGGVKSNSGNNISSEFLRNRIKEFIEAEQPGKALSDDKLTKMLESEGYPVKRRTVAQYREQLGIASSFERNKLNK